MSKRWLYVVGALLVFGGLTGSCEKDLLYTNFSINRTNDFKVPPLTQPIRLPEGSDTMSLEGDKEFEINDTRLDQVEHLSAGEVDFYILKPESRTFSFIKDIQLYVEAEGLPRKLVAERNNVPDDVGRRLEMKTKEDVDLTPYAKKETFTIVYGGSTDETTDSETKVEIDYVFDVRARVVE